MSNIGRFVLHLGMGNIVSLIALLGIATMLVESVFIGIALIGLAITLYGYGLKEIPANPPSVGLLTVWGERTNKVVEEGYRLLAPFFPIFLDVILVSMTTVNQDFVSKFFCKVDEENNPTDTSEKKSEDFRAGIQVSLSSAITWRPDKDRLLVFLDNKGESGVRSILDDILPQVLRVEGTRRTFESLTAGKQDLIDTIIAMLVKEDYLNLDKSQREAFHGEMKNGGKKDILGLGITIFKVNIGEPEPSEESKKDIESLAKEQFQRRSEIYEVSTEIAQAKELFQAYNAAGEVRTFHDCILEIRRRKSIREGHGQILEIPGIESLGPIVGPVIAGLAAATKGTASNTPRQSQQATPDVSGAPQQSRRRGNKPSKG